MMGDFARNTGQASPKTSPRGSRSPAYPRQDSSGTLKTTIALGKNPSIIQKGPFYLVKELPAASPLTGATNLIQHYNLEHSYNKSSGRKVKEELSSFLPGLPGHIDTPGHVDNSCLRTLVDKPPITGRELHNLTGSQLQSFRLHPGPLPEQYQLMTQAPVKKRHKHKKHRKEGVRDGVDIEQIEPPPTNETYAELKRNKKQRKSEKDVDDKDKKKRKKEKKKRKEKDKDGHD